MPGMELWLTFTSPFARKVRIAAHELGLHDRLQLIETNPWSDPRLRRLNPLSKVPTLVLDSGEVLWESGVICDYFDRLSDGNRLFPETEPERRQALLLQGLADGACTSAGRLFADEQRPPGERSEAMLERFKTTLEAVLDHLDASSLSVEAPTIGEISVAALLGYLDFRWPDREWLASRPKLAQWFAAIEQRPSMAATRHRLATPSD